MRRRVGPACPDLSHLPVTEIRDYGDRDLIVLFTRDQQTYRRFKEWSLCKREVAYTAGLGGRPFAADLYFPRPMESLLRRLSGATGTSRRSSSDRTQTRLPGF